MTYLRQSITALWMTVAVVMILFSVTWAELPTPGAAPPVVGAPPVILAPSAVLMDASTGTVLFAQNEHAQRPVASTTKILTALLALEYGQLNDTVIISDRATKVEGSALGLKPGERITLDTLLTTLLLKSANDAALAIAEHIGGSVEGFAQKMTARAQELGAKNSHFMNPNGLYDPNHYSSAYDLALFTREAMKHPRFRDLVRAKTVEILRPDLLLTETMINHNKLLWRDDTVDGVKTGYVKESGHCLVASATRNDWQLISVVLNSPAMYDESQALLDWGFANFTRKILANPGDALGQAAVRYGRPGHVAAVCEFYLSAIIGPGLAGDAHVEVKINNLRAPVMQGQRVGEARLVADGKVLQISPLVAKNAIPKSPFIVTLVWLLWIIVGLIVAVLLIRMLALFLRARRRRRQRTQLPSARTPSARQ